MQEDDEVPGKSDVPADAQASTARALSNSPEEKAPEGKKNFAQLAKSAIFREIVLAKVKEAKEQEVAAQVEKEVQDKAAQKSYD